MRQLILFVSISLAGLLSSGCAHVVIADDEWCADAGAMGARCTTSLSGQQFSLNKYQWDKLRVGQICTATQQPGLGYKNIKVPLEKLCADSNLCTPAQKAQLEWISHEVDGMLSATLGNAPFSEIPPPAKSADKQMEDVGLQPEK